MTGEMMQLTDRVRAMKPSSTLAVTARFKQMKAQGHDVIGFGAGEPDFDTPAHIKAAAVEALQHGRTKYEPTNGTPEALAAIAKYGIENQVDYISTGGGAFLEFLEGKTLPAFAVLVERGSE